MPKKRNSQNEGLPPGWRHRYGAYYYRVPKGQEEHWDGKREFKLGKTLSEAFRVYGQHIAAQEDPSAIRTMDKLFDRYLQEVTPKKKSPATRRHEPPMILTLKRIFNDSVITAIKPTHIYKVYGFLKERGLTTANRHMEKLSHVFTKAIEWGLLEVHPMTNRKFVRAHAKPKKVYITDEQIEQALTVAPPLIRAYVTLKLITGVRMTDMLLMEWKDWDEHGLHVTPSKTVTSSGVKLLFKRSERLDEVMATLKALNPLDVPRYVFTTREGKPYIKDDLTTSAFKSMWQRWMKKVEDKFGYKFTEKQLRVKVGSDAATDEDASKLLGHSNTITTIKHYRAKAREIQT